MSVDILMATFNGEKYIRNQILSLLQQTYTDWTLWIRDDGSSDRTIAIVDEFSAYDRRIRRVENDDFRSGPGLNFFKLIEYATKKYTIFCDQDDIWFEKKLEIMVGFAADNFDESIPCFVYADGHAYSDAEGIIISNSISHLHATKLEEFLFFNAGYQGCSMLFNACMANMAREYRGYFYMHDDLISLLGHVFGKAFFIPKPLMLYRQHDNNVTGKTSRSLAGIAANFFRRDAFVLSRRHYEEKAAFYSEYCSQMKRHDRLLFERYLEYPKTSLLGRLQIVLLHGFSVGGYKIPLLLKTILRRALE